MTRGLKDCTDDDVIIFSDLDEIPNPDKIREILQIFRRTGSTILRRDCFTVI